MDVDALRALTRDEHERTEAQVSLMDDNLTPAQYADVLRRFYPPVRGWELWAERGAPEAYRPLLAARQRSGMLAADLSFWGAEPLPEALGEAWFAEFAGEAGFMGAMYVVEGSTLGGQYIARRLEERFGLAPGEGDAYFRGYGEATGARWREVKAALAALPAEQLPEVVGAAKRMFGVFGAALRG